MYMFCFHFVQFLKKTLILKWALFMGFEHERIHLETSSVLIRQLPLHMVTTPQGWKYAPLGKGFLLLFILNEIIAFLSKLVKKSKELIKFHQKRNFFDQLALNQNNGQ